MVNKAALAVLGVIVLVSMGVGVLIGLQLGGSGSPVGDGAGDSESEGPTPIPTDTSTATSTPTPTATATAIPPTEEATTTTERSFDDRTTVPARRFDRRDIEREARELINERRRENDLEELVISGNTVDTITEMARRHSNAMADEGRLSHTIEGNTSESRYRDAGLYDTCQFTNAGDSYVIAPDDNSMESLARTFAGRPYQDGPRTEFNENETEIARELVETWFENAVYRERLTYENAQHVSVGVEITRDGTVYATANVC